MTAPLAAGLILAGCASQVGTPAADPFRASEAGPRSIELVVQNLNFANARLYWTRAGARKPLGTIGGKQDKTFTIPWNFSQPLSIEINLLAGPTCTTREMMVDPGDTLELQIASVFRQSSFCR